MIFGPPGKPTKLKKTVYLISWTLSGVLLSFIAHGLIEINYLKEAQEKEQIVPFYGYCTLKPELQIGLFLAGLAGGFLLGLFWWQKVYVERSRVKNTF